MPNSTDFLSFLGRLHPLIVHFPLSLIWVVFFLEIIDWRKQTSQFKSAIQIILWVISVSTVIAVTLGLILANHDDYAGSSIVWHKWLGISTLVFALLMHLSHYSDEIKSFRALLFMSVLLVTFAGHFGALLTHGEDYLNINADAEKKMDSLEIKRPVLDIKQLQGKIQVNQKEALAIEAKAILMKHCVDCHGPKKIKGKLRLDDLSYILKGGENGDVIVIGNSQKSEIIRRIKLPASHDDAMPTKGKRLNKSEIEVLETWIKQGAPWPNASNKINNTLISTEKQVFDAPSSNIKESNLFQEKEILTSAPVSEVLTSPQVNELNIKVRTILAHNCYSCHNATKTKGKLRLDKKEFLFKGGENGPILLAGFPEKSDIIRRVKLPEGHDDAMPTKGKRLTFEDIALLEYWIKQGAPWPEGPEKSLYRVADLEPRLPNIPAFNGQIKQPIDLFVDQYFKKNKIAWKKPIDDNRYIRRVYLDVQGLLPSNQQVQQFIADKRPNKRALLVETLLKDNSSYAQHWLSFWNDVLRNDYSGTGYITGGRFSISKWLYGSLKNNKSYDQFVKELISPNKDSEGFIKGIKWRGTINSSQSTEMQAAQNVAQVFLGLNLKCASCHDSFISDWKLDEAYAFANVFSDQQLEIHRCDLPTGRMAGKGVLYNSLGKIKDTPITADRLVQLADILVQKKNGRLYRTLVNRVWAQLMGRGIVEPVDMMDNEPWSQDLLDYLAYDFANNGTDIKRLMYQILTSQTYQLPSVGFKEVSMVTASNYVFKGMTKRRLTAEQFADAVSQSFFPLYTDSALVVKMLPSDIKKDIPFVRAALVKNDPFLTSLGRPNRETVSTSRTSQANLLQALELTNGTKFNYTLNTGAKIWVSKYQSSVELVNALYRESLNRMPSARELELALRFLGKKPSIEGVQDFVWAITLLPEFQLII